MLVRIGRLSSQRGPLGQPFDWQEELGGKVRINTHFTLKVLLKIKTLIKGLDSNLDSLLAFLRTMHPQKIAAPLIGKSAFNRHRKGLEFCPVIDGELIPEEPERLRQKVDWPMEVIVGGTEFEGLLFCKFFEK